MAVPNRPTSGAPIETAWGDVAHDTIVAQDVQAGRVTIPAASAPSAQVVVVFPRPFSAPPVVVISASDSGGAAIVAALAATATQFTAYHRHRADSNVTAETATWLAYGPRA